MYTSYIQIFYYYIFYYIRQYNNNYYFVNFFIFVGIINGLNSDITPNKPNYLPNNPQNFEQSNPQPQPTNYEKPHRRRRSLADNQIDSGEDSKLYDQVTSKLKQFFFEKDNQTEERSSYDDVQRKIADLKYRLGEPKVYLILFYSILFCRRPHGHSKNWSRI